MERGLNGCHTEIKTTSRDKLLIKNKLAVALRSPALAFGKFFRDNRR